MRACCPDKHLSPFPLQVAVPSEHVEVMIKYLLIEWLDGTRPTLDHFPTDQRKDR